MTHENGHIDRAAARLQGVEILGEVFEGPVVGVSQPSLQRFERHALDVLENPKNHLAMLGARRRNAEATIAQHHRSHSMPGRDREVAVPQDLGVVVGVDVDEARRHDAAVGFETCDPRYPRPLRGRRSCRRERRHRPQAREPPYRRRAVRRESIDRSVATSENLPSIGLQAGGHRRGTMGPCIRRRMRIERATGDLNAVSGESRPQSRAGSSHVRMVESRFHTEHVDSRKRTFPAPELT